MAGQAVTIQITGDESDLKKALQRAAKDIEDTAAKAKKSGTSTGDAFGTGFSGGFRSSLRFVTDGFKDVQTTAEGGFAAIGQSFLSKAVNPITIGIATLGASVYAAFQFAKIGEENEKIAKNFARFANDAGLDADRLKQRISGIAEGFVDLEDILPRAGEAVISLGKNASRLPEILELARNIGVATGRDVKDVFDDLTKGIENQNVKLLRNNNIRLDANKVLEDYAAKNDTVKEKLSEAAKQQAFLNAALEQGSKNFGTVGAQAAPIAGGIKQLELAFDDLKDAIAAIVNSNLGTFFADIISGTAKATKAVADFFQPEVKDGEGSLNDQIEQTKNKITELVNLKLKIPFGFDEKLLEQTTQKLKDLYALQDERAKASAEEGKLTKEEIVTGESESEMTARLEKERQAQADIAAIRAEARIAEQQAETDHKIALLAIESEGNANTQAIRDASVQAALQKNQLEFEAAVAKNSKIAEADKLAAANSLALEKKKVADQKILDQEGVANAKLTAEAKQKIEENLFNTALFLARNNAEATKALNVAQAIRNTYQGATLALATYPPPFNVAAAASTVALGVAQVAKIVGANNGALVTGGQTGVDNQPFLLSKGEIVAPAKSFDEVVEGTARQRGYSKGGESSETDALLRELIAKIDARNIAVTVNTDVIADENGINALVTRIRDAIDFNAAPSLG